MKIKNILNLQFVKFVLVGFLNTCFGYGIYALMLFIGVAYPIASLISTVLGIIFNFKTTGLIVFKNRKNGLIIKFFLVYLINYIAGLGLLYVMKTIGINLYLAGFIGIIILVYPTYLLNKKFVFENIKNKK